LNDQVSAEQVGTIPAASGGFGSMVINLSVSLQILAANAADSNPKNVAGINFSPKSSLPILVLYAIPFARPTKAGYDSADLSLVPRLRLQVKSSNFLR
jgi:hypothetical protein